MDGRTDTPLAALLLLADGRLPTGGYAHSGGLEPAVVDDRVRDLRDAEAFVVARTETSGVVAAAFASATCAALAAGDGARLAVLDAGLDARMPSPAQRLTSRQLGRQLLRAIAAMGAGAGAAALPGDDPHRAVAVGLGAATLGLGPRDAALAMLYDTAASVVAAAIRLLGLDPLAAYAGLARLTPRLDELARAAAEGCDRDVDLLPALASPQLDVYAERHAARTARLFSS